MARVLSTRLRQARRAPDYRLNMTGMPFELVAATRMESPLLFVCDHASNALPAPYGTLGLAPELFGTHIASDIGAAEVTRALAAAFGAGAVLGRWSRLLIDLNRGADDPTLVMKLSDGSLIPGNARINRAEIENRIENFHAPDHAAIAREIAAMRVRDLVPVIVAGRGGAPGGGAGRRPGEGGGGGGRD